MITISHLCKSFNGQTVLDDINLDIKQGEIIAVFGPSGSGKSVLLQHLIGLIRPDSGSIVINGTDIVQLTEEQLLPVRKDIGYLFQEGALYDFMTVFENIAFPLVEHTRLDRNAIQGKVSRILSHMDLNNVERKYPTELSGGMKKRVALSRALILDSKILFCDEPTSGLDPHHSRSISDLILRVSREFGCTTVFTSHDVQHSLPIADRVALISQGQIVAKEKKDDFMHSQNIHVQKFLKGIEG